MKRLAGVLSIAMLGIAPLGSAATQAQPEQKVLVTVLDKDGLMVNNLHAEDFSLELDSRPQSISSFTSSPDTPTSIGILLARSPTMFSDSGGPVLGVNAAVGAARISVKSLIKPGDETMLMEVQSSFRIVEPFTADTSKIDSALRSSYAREVNASLVKRMAIGLFAAALKALDQMNSARHSKRALIIVTDGFSSDSPAVASGTIRGRELPVYWLGIKTLPNMHAVDRPNVFDVARPGDQERWDAEDIAATKNFFKSLAEETGGRAEVIAPNIDGTIADRVVTFTREIDADLRGQYQLGFYAQGAGFQTMRIRAKNPDYRVQVRRLSP